MGAKAKERAVSQIIQGLAGVVGLSPDAEAFDVLKTVAETLGCTVADDGSTRLIDEGAEPAGRGRKRRRGGAAAAVGGDEEQANGEGEAGAEEEEDAEDAEDEEEEENREEGDEEADASHSSDGEPEGEEEEEELEDFDLTMEPVKVEDPRTLDMVADQEGIDDGEALFQWLISPVDVETFYDAIHEDEPLLVTRPNNRAYFKGLFSKDEVDQLLRRKTMQYTFNVDVTSYAGKTRTNYNYNGDVEPAAGTEAEMADADSVWRRFNEGCSVRMLHPQRFCDPLWRLLGRLEGFLQCPVGCNAYLTPAGTQGFAPHWDDIDAFVLQVEGQKRWRLYTPTDPEHVLPRYSSRDFMDEELGECALDVVLQPGDILYMPRGTVHQAESLPDSHSLHLTISANQQRSWAVFLEEALPQALRQAAQQNRELRRTLPRDYFDFMGVTHEREEGEEGGDEEGRREEFTQHCAELIETVMHHMPLDQVADELAVQFLQQRMPPPRKGAVAAAAKAGGDEAAGSGALTKGTFVQLAQPGIARLVIDAEGAEPVAAVHHCMANRRDLHAHTLAAAAAGVAAAGGGGEDERDEELAAQAAEASGVIEFPIECAETIDILLTAGSGLQGSPEAVQLAELPEPDAECGATTQAVVQALLDAGVLAVKAP